MAKSPNNGALSGVLGNVIFVNQGSKSYIRSKPGKVKQTTATKTAASAFGWVSQKDKKYRFALTQAYSVITDRYYAARHRARMGKALNPLQGTVVSPASVSENLPQALEGFEFNTHITWEKTCHFYINFTQDNNIVECNIPALTLGQNVKAPKDVRSAKLQCHAFMVDPNQPDIDLTPISSHECTLLPVKTVPETVWSFDIPHNNAWVVVLGTLTFDYTKPVDAHLRGCTTYLFAKGV